MVEETEFQVLGVREFLATLVHGGRLRWDFFIRFLEQATQSEFIDLKGVQGDYILWTLINFKQNKTDSS